MMRQRDSLQKRYEAVRRGAAARADRGRPRRAGRGGNPAPAEQGRDGYRLIRAPMLGDHARNLSACWRRRQHGIRDTDPPDRRHEPPEDPARDGRAGRRAPASRAGGLLSGPGETEAEGRLVVKTIIPMFGPRRLFNPDTSAAERHAHDRHALRAARRPDSFVPRPTSDGLPGRSAAGTPDDPLGLLSSSDSMASSRAFRLVLNSFAERRAGPHSGPQQIPGFSPRNPRHFSGSGGSAFLGLEPVFPRGK